MRSIAIVFLLLVTAWTAAAQKVGGNDDTLVLKNGTLVLNGVKLKTSESIIAVLGEEVYRERWKPAVSMRSVGIPLMAVGSGLLAWGMYGYITALTSEWPQAELEPERWEKMNTAYNITKIMSGGGVLCLGAGIPLFCIGNGRMKSIRDNYNQGLAVSLAPCGLGLCYRF